ncbi:MAG TPA: ABC transporter substrate-binding protein [Beutenbergiaceae bacterium]|nr:ABC transporter substrate-binding protein [Beutenbergiaceae bacterium]
MSTSHPRPRSTMLRAAAGSAAAATLVLATGCNGIGGSDDLTEIEIALPTGVTSMANSDIAVADELGYFEEAGLEVEVTNLRSGSSVTNGVVGGDFQFGGASIEPVINAFAGGADIRVIAGYTDRLEVDVVVPEEVQNVADLQGRELGIQEIGAFREVMTRMMLEDAQMTPEDVEYVSVSADAYVSALIQGQIASAVLHPEQAIQATEQLEDAGEVDGLHSLLNLYEVEPDYFYGAYFVSAAWLEENPEQAQAFAEAITRAHRTMYDDREEVVPIIASEVGMDEEIIDQAWETYMVDVQAFPVNEGVEEDRLAYTLERMEEMATLADGAEPDLDELVDRTPIEAAVEELGRVDERD